ncbi:MAG: SGNH/GDSL hydrolase family protein [Microcoleus sp. SIO2G3]|nr:SGNH/GDSL hydrolase family protein [Microcoleus sp. SIO2G3]
MGFGNPPIYITDEKIGYLLAPNQHTRRFGNRMAINEFSMRSATISLIRPASTLRVLLLGDSVANGAWWTDQNQTISALIATQLKSLVCSTSSGNPKARSSFEQVDVLNASANSWGPRNELAYLQHFGTFNAQVVVLLINTDDLFATAPTSIPVGRDRNYPNRKPPTALAEVFNRYVLKATSIPEMNVVNAEPGDRVGFNLEAIRQIQILANANGAQLVVAMTPLLREIGNPGSRDYELKARIRLAKLIRDLEITYLDFLPVFNGTQTPQTLYRDHIHLSPKGNQVVSEIIGRSLSPLLQAIALVPTTEPTKSD